MTGKAVAVMVSQALQLSQNQDTSETRNHAYELDALVKSNDGDFTKPSYELSIADLFEGPTVGSNANMETLWVLIKAQGAE